MNARGLQPASPDDERRPRGSATRHRELGLTDAEYELIVDKLGREPNEVELAVFSLMWSEHCGYKHSRRLLKTLPTEGGRLVIPVGPADFQRLTIVDRHGGRFESREGEACTFVPLIGRHGWRSR